MGSAKKLNNRGYMLLETLIVSVFLMTIFTLLYTNLFPLVGEYDRYKDYNTVEATYIAHWMRKFALDGLPDTFYNQAKTKGYVDISDCNQYTNQNMASWCAGFTSVAQVKQVYLTTYSTDIFKNFVKDNHAFSRAFQEYIAYLPSYAKNTSKQNYYRVIVAYELDGRLQFGTIELNKNAARAIPSESTSQINVADSANGLLTVTPSQASQGDIITLEATPDAGYQYGGATIVDTQGNTILTLSAYELTFEMPANSITIIPNWTVIS